MHRLFKSFSHGPANCCFIHITRSLCASVVPYKLTDIGEGIRQVEVLNVSVKPGDRIEEFDRICDVQSDKATVEITSRYAGVVKAVHIACGTKALVGMPIVDIELDEEQKPVSQTNDDLASAAPSAQSPPQQQQQQQQAQQQEQKQQEQEDEEKQEEVLQSKGRKTVLATPATRRMARDHKINLSQVLGTGKGGRIMKEDVLSFITAQNAPQKTTEAVKAGGGVGAKVDVAPADEVVPIVGIRRVMVKTMTEANSIPSFSACEEIDVTSLMTLRGQLRSVLVARSGNEEAKLSILPFLLKASSLALRQYPTLNAHVMPGCESMIIKGSHHIGIAVDTPNGLIVPVLRDVQQKSIIDLALEVNELVALGRKNRLGPDCMRGATFTLSNIGSIGATYAVPIVSPPQVAIGATGRLQTLPRFDAEGNVVKATVMCVSWTADHRVIDGATLVRFGNVFKNYLETPALMMGDMR